jgi:hypothetical protein
MHYETPFAAVTADSGLVSGILHVSPMFVRFGPPTRGTYGDVRVARTLRSDARQARCATAGRRRGSHEFSRFFENDNAS